MAQALWKEDIRECKILAGLLQPVDSFFPEIADIWVESIQNIEIAELTSMNLFQHLPYAPAKSFQWIADEREYVQMCGFLTIARLLMKKGDMNERTANEFLDQAVCTFISGSYHVRNAAMAAIRRFMQHSEEHASGNNSDTDGNINVDDNESNYASNNESDNESSAVRDITIIVNNGPVTLSGKSHYILVDLFQFYDFDLSKPKGNIVILLNGETCEYTASINDGDVVKIYWE